MITQFVEEIPEGNSHPDFTRKPIALTIQEGKVIKQYESLKKKKIVLVIVNASTAYLHYSHQWTPWKGLHIYIESILGSVLQYVLFSTGKLAIFKAIVTGEPTPTVTWSRNNGEISDPEQYQPKFDPLTGEHTLEVSIISHYAIEYDYIT